MPLKPERSMASVDHRDEPRRVAAGMILRPGHGGTRSEADFFAGRNGSITIGPAVSLARISGRAISSPTTTSPLRETVPAVRESPDSATSFGPPRSRALRSRPPILPAGRYPGDSVRISRARSGCRTFKFRSAMSPTGSVFNLPASATVPPAALRSRVTMGCSRLPSTMPAADTGPSRFAIPASAPASASRRAAFLAVILNVSFFTVGTSASPSI